MDPPYNTESAYIDGNLVADDKENINPNKFIYRDKFSRNGWLTMMDERLRLAHKLLKENGVIFVSIDDSEQAYLKVLMDEIFGADNFIANIIRQTKTGGGRFGKNYIQKDIDYILVFCKNKLLLPEFGNVESDWDDYKFKDKRGLYAIKHPLDGGAGQKSYIFPVELNGQTYYPREDKNWSFSKDRVDFMIENDFIVANSKGMLYVKNYKDWKVDKNTKTGEYEIVERKSGISWSSSKMITKEFNNAAGNNEIKQIFDDKIFSYPKPVSAIKALIKMVNNKNARVLDFFAGSGTTGHAVEELNSEDNGFRSYTLITNNQSNIGEIITYERLFRINNGIGANGEEVKWAVKNNPYKSNLDLFYSKRFNTNLENEISTEYLINLLKQELADFNISRTRSDIEYCNLLNLLKSLIEKEDENEIN
nr:site-specific DNA-methyltransferase [Mycoplasma sp. NEAQ87857]